MLASEKPNTLPHNQFGSCRPVFCHPARSHTPAPASSTSPAAARLPIPGVTGGNTLPGGRPTPPCSHLVGTGFFLFLPAYIPPAAPSTGRARSGLGATGGRARRRGLRRMAAGLPRPLLRTGPCTGPPGTLDWPPAMHRPGEGGSEAHGPWVTMAGSRGGQGTAVTVGRDHRAHRVTVLGEPPNPEKHCAHGPLFPGGHRAQGIPATVGGDRHVLRVTVHREPPNPGKHCGRGLPSPGSHQILGNTMPTHRLSSPGRH